MVRKSLAIRSDNDNPNVAEIKENVSNFWIVFDYDLN